jgi:Transposase DDE domain
VAAPPETWEATLAAAEGHHARARPGSKHHILTEAGGVPLVATLTGGNHNDVTQLLPLLDKVPPYTVAAAGLADAQTSCTPTAPTTVTSTAVPYASGASAARIARRGQAPRFRSGRLPLGRREDHRLVPRHEAPAYPLGTPRRHPRSVVPSVVTAGVETVPSTVDIHAEVPPPVRRLAGAAAQGGRVLHSGVRYVLMALAPTEVTRRASSQVG